MCSSGGGTNLLSHDFSYIEEYGCNGIIGVDEAGRGSLAGPVMAAAVWADKSFYEDNLDNDELLLINDSKQLSQKARNRAFELLQNWQKLGKLYFAYAEGSVTEIEVGNIVYALKLAMRRALERVALIAEVVLPISEDFKEKYVGVANNEPTSIFIDGYKLKNFSYVHEGIVKGDQKSFCIAAASIVAKVKRDSLMERLSVDYPQYNFGENKGYGTQKHRDSIEKYGPSDMHRRSFLKKLLKNS